MMSGNYLHFIFQNLLKIILQNILNIIPKIFCINMLEIFLIFVDRIDPYNNI